jgi:hypothetical protein
MFNVGRSGDILFSDGATWAPMQSDVTVLLESVWGTGIRSSRASAAPGCRL